jgi:hypothetical protein
VVARRVDVADGAMPMVPVQAGPEIREDVPEQVGGHHHVEPVRVEHEVGGEDVDVVLVHAHVRVALPAIAATRSSQYGMVIEMPLDFVAR